MNSHAIYLYKEEIKQQCLQLFGSLDRLESYIAVVFAHEIGHAEDAELASLATLLEEARTDREQAEIALQIEENAWNYAELLLEGMDDDFLQLIINESLWSYRHRLEPATA